MSGSQCEGCGTRLYYVQRLHRHRWCQRCAAERGVDQFGDPARENVMLRAASVPQWWRWSVWLGRALLLRGARP